ncbi:RHS repeat-associated core domain-containing protein [Duganella sp. CF458]|uniref:RHS repeat-associated core domain-containing protein n=1 Tax=Duganella sp. CF458 TaxID=1884368 RepID=UPI0008EB1207|nr:RHS repeat-associated core domain-containing protein [Duganella sp. CF458]SFG91026.1 RHS repeat-associated core domain-containing protein [Duganella sp. CF458]
MFRNSTMQRIIASALLATFASSTVAPVVAYAQTPAPFTLQPLAGAAGRSLPGVDANGIPTGKGWQRPAASSGSAAATAAAPTQAYGFALSQLEAMAGKSEADLAAGRGSDALAQVNALRAQYVRLKKEEAVMAQSFAATEAHLRAAGLASGDILARQQQALQDFGARKEELKAAMAALDAAAGGKGSVQTALDGLARLMKRHSSLPGQGAHGKGHAWGKKKKAPPAVAMTERQHEKRFPRSVLLAAAGSLSGIALPDAILPDAVQPGDLAQQGEVVLTPAVRALAAQLGNNPVAIYNWVRNNIAFAPGFGAMQDADATLLARRGSATDTASLLIALNRAAGIASRYVYGTIEVPVAKINNWLGVDHAAAAQALLAQAGIPHRAVSQAGQAGAIQLEHVWVEALVDFSPSRGGVNKAPGAWVPLDASFKQMDVKPGLDLANAVSLNESGLLGQVRQGAVCTPDYAQSLNLQNLQAGYADYKTRLNSYLGQQGADLTVGDVLGNRSIAARNYSILLGSLPYTKVAQGTIVNALPDNLRWQFRLQLFAGAAQQAANTPAVSYSGSLASVANQRLTLSFVPASQADADVLASYMPKQHADGSPIQPGELPLEVPGYLVRVKAEIRADGELVASGGSFVLGSELAGSIASFDPSSGDWNESSFGAHAGDYHAVAVDTQGVSAGQLAALKARLNAMQAKLAGGQGASLTRDDVSGELLYHAALGYFATVDANAGVFQRAARMVDVRQPSYGRAVAQAQPEMVMGIINKVRFPGVVLDIDRLDSAVAQNTGGLAPSAYIKQANERNAAYGHLVLAKLFTSAQTPGQAASPLKALSAAAGAGNKVFAVTGANAASVMPLVDIAANAAADIRNSAAAGSRVLVAQGPVNIGNWNGHGLAMEDAGGAGNYRLYGETGYATAALYLPNGTTWLALASPLQAAGAAVPAAQAAQPVNDTLASLLGEAGSTTRWRFYAGQADVASGLFLARLSAGQAGSACDILTGTIAAGLDTSGGFDSGAVAGAPLITSAPVISGGANQLYSYAVLATDPKGAALAYALREAPTGMAISATGVISWNKPVAGVWNVTVRADNGRAYAEQRYQLTVGQEVPLDANLRITPQVINLGESVTIDVLSTGGSGNVTRSLAIDGQEVALTQEGRATVTGSALGAHQITAKITDSLGTTTRVGTYSVRDPADSSTPVALIAAPVDDAEVTAPVDVTGTATAANLAYYQLLLRPSGGSAWSEIARGTSAVSNGVLGKLDPTQLANGIYELVLSVVDANGRQQTRMITVDVYRDLKIGQFALTYIDLDLEAAGVPIRVSRTYDTRRKDEKLDFGYGWSVDYQNVQVRKNMVLGLQWDVIARSTQLLLCIVPAGKRKINITLPDGKVERFSAANRQECAMGQIPPVDVYFTPLPGTTSSLEIVNVPNLMARGGQLFDMDALEPWNPKEYKLVTEDNFSYYITEGIGIVQVKDPAGNTLTYGRNGILHSGGQSVSFTRDAQNRITAVTDPSGKSIAYAYDPAGDLVKVTNRVGAASNYAYNRAHGLVQYTDPNGNVAARYVYDDEGRLVAAYDAEGKAIRLQHDGTSNRETITDRRGNQTIYAYDSKGNVTERIDALGNKTSFEYDALGNESVQTNPLGGRTTRVFNQRTGKQTSETDAAGNETRWEYDSTSGTYVEKIVDPNGNITNFGYSLMGSQSVTEPMGRVNSVGYDGSRNMTSVRVAGRSRAFTYNLKGTPATETDGAGTRITYGYNTNNQETSRSWTVIQDGVPKTYTITRKLDAEGRAVEETDALGFVTKTEYNAGGQVLAKIDPLGRRTGFAYTVRGQVSKITYPDGTSQLSEYDAERNLVATTDQAGRVTRHEYDALNRRAKTIFPDGGTVTNEYDAAGRLVAVTDQLGQRTVNGYDAAGRLVSLQVPGGAETKFEYDKNGNVSAMTDAAGRVTKYEYDGLDRLVKATLPDGKFAATVWTVANTKQSEKDYAGNEKSYEYDGAWRLKKVTMTAASGGQATVFEYDELGNKTSQTDAEARVTRWTYDANSRMTGRTLPDGKVERFDYDAAGNQTGKTDFAGKTTRFAVDSVGRTEMVVRPDGGTVSTTYSATGKPASVTLAGKGLAAGTTTFIYDSADRLSRKVNADGSFIAYEYDQAGDIVARSTAAGTVRYAYDNQRRIEKVTDVDGKATTYQYAADGKLEAVVTPDGITARYRYDSNGRLVQGLHSRGDNSIVFGVQYVLDANGRRTQAAEFDASSTLAGEALSNPVVTNDFEFDAYGRLMREQAHGRNPSADSDTKYKYDKVGNRTERARTSGAVTAITNYNYDNNDRLLSETTSTGNSQVETSYAWDANGNLLSKAVGGLQTFYGWDADNRLVEVKQGASQAQAKTVAQYAYDGNGNRVAKTEFGDNGEKTRQTTYLVDSTFPFAQVLEQKEVTGASTESTRYVWGKELIREVRGGQGTFYHSDPQGSVRILAGDDGQAAGSYRYDAFGQVLEQGGTADTAYRYTGEYFDAHAGLQYNRARWVDLESGRFVSMDRFAGVPSQPISLHRYAYANDDPVNMVDPSGNETLGGQMAALDGQSSLQNSAIAGIRQAFSRFGCDLGAAIAEQAVDYGIYILIDAATGGLYVGQSVDIDNRLKQHIDEAVKQGKNLWKANAKILMRFNVPGGKEALYKVEQLVMDILEKSGHELLNKNRAIGPDNPIKRDYNVFKKLMCPKI